MIAFTRKVRFVLIRETYIIEVTGTDDKLDAFITAIDRKLIMEVVRSGAIGVGRGEKALRV